MTDTEERRWITWGDPRYQVSSDGQVRSLTYGSRGGSRKRKQPRLLKQRLDADGYPVVTIGQKAIRVHKLVATAFYGPRPEGMECCHANGNRQDNRVENLRWGSRLENKADSIRHGTAYIPPQKGSLHSQAKLTEEKVLLMRKAREEGATLTKICQEFSVPLATASQVCSRKTWKHV
jgi:hypothetical protein